MAEKKNRHGIIEKRNKKGELVAWKFMCCVGRDDEYRQVWRTCTIKPTDERLEGLTPKKLENALDKIKYAWDEEQKTEYEKSRNKEDRSKITFKQFVENHWMKDHVKTADHTPSSVRFFEYTSQMAVEYFDKKKLKDIDVEAVKRYLNHLKETPTKTTGEPFGASSVKHFYGTLKNIMRYAKRLHYIENDPCEDLSPKEKPHREKKKIDFLEPEEAKHFLSCLKDESLFWQCMFNVLLIVGLRRGEACGLQWQDLDDKKLELSVSRNVTLDKNSETGFNIGKTKNGTERIVPISSRLCKMLQKLKADREYDLSEKDENGNVTVKVTIMPTGFIFSNVTDPYKPIRPDSVTTKTRRFVEKNGIRAISPHDLRHSAASLALEAGADLKEIQELLGHADPETTLRFYAGVTEERKRKTVDGIESMIVQ